MGIATICDDYRWRWTSADGTIDLEGYTSDFHFVDLEERTLCGGWGVSSIVVQDRQRTEHYNVTVRGRCVHMFNSRKHAEEFMWDMHLLHLTFKPLFQRTRRMLTYKDFYFPEPMRAEGEAMMAKRNAWMKAEKQNIFAAMRRIKICGALVDFYHLTQEKLARRDGDGRIVRRILDMLGHSTTTHEQAE